MNRHPSHQKNSKNLVYVQYAWPDDIVIEERQVSESNERHIKKARTNIPMGATQFRFYSILGFQNETGPLYVRPDIQKNAYQPHSFWNWKK